MADAEKKPLSIAETIEAYAWGEKFPKRKITEEQEKEWTAFLEEQRRKDYGEKKQEILPPSAK